jgi:hypothetical protein
MVGCSWLIFCLNFPRTANNKMTIGKFGIYLSSLIMAVLSFSDLIIKDFGISAGVIRFGYGHLWTAYVGLLFIFFLSGGVNLTYKLFRLSGIEKVQTVYVLIGSSISLAITIVINIFLSNTISLDYLRFGIYGIVFFIAFTAYAIIRHHLMNIKVIGSELLSLLLVGASFVQLFIFNSFSEFVIRVIIFLFSLIIAWLLVRSVLQEVKKREEIEKLNIKLEKTSKNLAVSNKELRSLRRLM